MKEFLDKNKHRLGDGEKNAIWQEISQAQAGKKRRHWVLRPALGATVVAVCGLAFFAYMSERVMGPASEWDSSGSGRTVTNQPEPFSRQDMPKKDSPATMGLGKTSKGDKAEEREIGASTDAASQEFSRRVDELSPAPEEYASRNRIVDSAEGIQDGGGSGDEIASLLESTPPVDLDRVTAAPVTPQSEDKRGRRSIPSQVLSPPNDQAYDTMLFEHYGVNPFIVTVEDSLSTFAVDVDNASYTLMRRYLRDGFLPPHAAVRVEEYINFFAQGYPQVETGDFAIHADGAPSPFGEGYHLLRIGIQGREVSRQDRRPANLVFVIDISGSMDRENRLGLVKRALLILLDELREGDTVAIVVYGSRGQVVLEPTGIAAKEKIRRAIDSLVTGGSTNAEEGLYLGYELARQQYQAYADNRLILCSDGVANQGRTGADSILDHVRQESDRGIGLSNIGFGMGNYNDVLMEQLADNADGSYYYVDDIHEAERVFRENLSGTLQTIARDVKVQVEFDPRQVLRYRLLGYENRDVADQDFRNDAVDAGEVGAGHEVTALYEIKLSQEAVNNIPAAGKIQGDARQPVIATVRLRYEEPAYAAAAGTVHEIREAVTTEALSPSFQDASIHLQLTAVVAEYAEILRGSYWAKGNQIARLVPMVDSIATELITDVPVQEFQVLVRQAADLQADE